MSNQGETVKANLSFAAPYWHEHLGVSYTQKYLSDPESYLRTGVEIGTHMREKRASLLGETGSDDAVGDIKENPVVGGYVTTTMPMMLGCEVEFQDTEYPYARPLDLTDEQVLALEPIVDFSDNPVMRDLEEQAAWLKEKYGRSQIRVNMQSVVNIVFKLRGEQIMFDFFEKPEIVHKIVDYTRQCWINAREWIDNVNRENGMPSDSGMVGIDNCNVALLSPDIYKEFFLPCDLKTVQHFGRAFGVHHCGGNMHQFADSYALLGQGVWYDIGFGSDVKECVEKYKADGVTQDFSVRFGPAFFRSAKPADVVHKLDQLAEGGASYVLCVGTDPDTTEENLKALWQWEGAKAE